LTTSVTGRVLPLETPRFGRCEVVRGDAMQPVTREKITAMANVFIVVKTVTRRRRLRKGGGGRQSFG